MRNRAGYAIFFLILASASLFCFISLEYATRWLFLWVALSGAVLAFAYALNRPALVCGKRPSGEISLVIASINFPWLLFTWIVWLFIAVLSREPRVNFINGTNIAISQYPLFGVDIANFERVIDLTAEFPRFYSSSGHYLCMPNLDGVELGTINSRTELNPNEKVLVHCAQGHGRSAAFVTLLLLDNSIFPTLDAAQRAIVNSRPGARVSVVQQNQLKDADRLISRQS